MPLAQKLCALYIWPANGQQPLLSVLTRPEFVFLRALGRCGVALWAHDVIRNTAAAHGCDPVRQGRIWVDAKHLAHVAPVPGTQPAACDAGGGYENVFKNLP